MGLECKFAVGFYQFREGRLCIDVEEGLPKVRTTVMNAVIIQRS